MSDTATGALPLTTLEQIGWEPRTTSRLSLNLTATYRFPFLRYRWLLVLGIVARSALMIVAGVFLLSQIAETPGLAVQMAVLGALLTGGGLLFLVHARGDLWGGLIVSPEGLVVANGRSSFSLAWSQVQRWRMFDQAAQACGSPTLEVWSTDAQGRSVVPGGRLNAMDSFLLHQLLCCFAGKQELN